MRKIRSKIIITLLISTLIPLLPLGYLVFDLVNQSYNVGINPQVEKALSQGFNFSRSVYKLQRNQLVLALEDFYLSKHFSETPFTSSITIDDISLDTAYWEIKALSYFDASINQVWRKNYNSIEYNALDKRVFHQFSSPRQRSLVISDRKSNRFTALLKINEGGKFTGYLAMETSLNPNFLQQTDHSLKIHQMYQALDLNQHFLPKRFLYAFLSVAFILFVVVVSAGVWISSLITRPITTLVKGTEEIGRGNLDHRLSAVNNKDEIGKLVGHFNDMVQKLQENQEQVIHLEKMAAWQQMARKLAHEIKNPLTPIQLTIQQIVDKYDNSDKEYQNLLQECYTIINEEIGSLRNLVTEFSDLGRLPKLNLSKNSINNLIAEIKVMYQEKVDFSTGHNETSFLFDSDRIRRVLINLIENAIQADPGNNGVKVITSFNEKTLILLIEDKGDGIPESDLKKIFEPHFTTKSNGMGLGLAISKLIIEEHNGTIKVQSKKGQGTTFIIELPISESG